MLKFKSVLENSSWVFYRDLVFTIGMFPLATILVLTYPAWHLMIWPVFAVVGWIYLRKVSGLKKGRLLLVWYFALGALGFLGVLGGSSIPSWMIAVCFTVLLAILLPITRTGLKKGNHGARHWLELMTYLTLFCLFAFFFGVTYVYAIPLLMMVVAASLVSLPIVRLVFQIRGHRLSMPLLGVFGLLLVQFGGVLSLLPISHTVIAAALLVFIFGVLTVYTSVFTDGWSWKRGMTRIGGCVVLQGVLLVSAL